MLPPRTTLDHTREILAFVDRDFQILQVAESFLGTSSRIDEPTKNRVESWCLDRMKELSGATSVKEALHHSDVVNLLAFAYLGAARSSEPMPRIDDLRRTPKILSELESDFLPVLRDEINSYVQISSPFRKDLELARERIRDLAARLETYSGREPRKEPPRVIALDSGASGSDAAYFAVGVASFCLLLWTITNIPDKVRNI